MALSFIGCAHPPNIPPNLANNCSISVQETDLSHFPFRRTLPRYPRRDRPGSVDHSALKWYGPDLPMKGPPLTPQNYSIFHGNRKSSVCHAHLEL